MLRLSRMQSTAVRATVRSLTLEEMETLWDELEAADTDGALPVAAPRWWKTGQGAWRAGQEPGPAA